MPDILLVEDKESLRRVLRLTLEAAGYTVTEAEDARAAAADQKPSSAPSTRHSGWRKRKLMFYCSANRARAKSFSRAPFIISRHAATSLSSPSTARPFLKL